MPKVKQKLVVCIMGQNCEKFIGMCLESVKDADNIVFCDGGSTDGTKDIIMKAEGTINTIHNEYKQDDNGMNGKQRNFYLNYLKENFPDHWALCLDADEVVADLSKIKDFIQEGVPGLYSVKMRHFIGDLGHEDAMQPEHYVLNRLFKVSEAGEYPEREHPVLQPSSKDVFIGTIKPTTIWHLSYIPNLWEHKKKFENHMKKSDTHPEGFLASWYRAHLFGGYPTTPIKLMDIPEVILNEFGIEKDEIYFAERKLELKHFLMMKEWTHGVGLKQGDSVIELGCGLGPYGIIAQDFLDLKYTGLELSEWAVKQNPFNINIKQADITKDLTQYIQDKQYDLVLIVDILEHLEEKDLDKTLKDASLLGKHYIFSIPYLGDPNLNADPTHIIKKDKQWWVEQLSKYFNVADVPEQWQYAGQLLYGVPK